MKIMISQPMTGRTNEEIMSERKEAVKYLESQGHEVIDTVFNFEDIEVKNKGLYYMGYSIVAMADVDLLVLMDGWSDSRGCRLEYILAQQYNLPTITLDDFMRGIKK